MAPPLPANSDERIFHLKHAKPEFVGSRGTGGEGKTSDKNRTLDCVWRQVTAEQTSSKEERLAPHPPHPSLLREFGLRLIKFQVNSSEFTRRGGHISQSKI